MKTLKRISQQFSGIYWFFANLIFTQKSINFLFLLLLFDRLWKQIPHCFWKGKRIEEIPVV